MVQKSRVLPLGSIDLELAINSIPLSKLAFALYRSGVDK